jgi:integrase
VKPGSGELPGFMAPPYLLTGGDAIVAHSTRSKKPTKPEKPYPDFPLFPHATRRWAKKIRGKLHYFGPWDDWQAALEKFQEQRDDLMAGRTPRGNRDGLTVRELCNRFMTAKETQKDAGDIVASTFNAHHQICSFLLGSFGKTRLVTDLAASDFEQLRAVMANGRCPTTLAADINRVRCVFNYAYNAGLVENPIRFGPVFKRPGMRVIRAHRQKQGLRMFEAKELRSVLLTPNLTFRTMVLLGINCGFGNHDCGSLTTSHLDLDGGWVNFPRPKTAVERRCPLWPETVTALRQAIAKRVKPRLPEHNDLVFLTSYGNPWTRVIAGCEVSKRMSVRLKKLGLYRPGLGFYALRHTFETIAGESRDQVAVNHIMGHADQSMAGVYRERISDERLQAVSDTVRSWLFGAKFAK